VERGTREGTSPGFLVVQGRFVACMGSQSQSPLSSLEPGTVSFSVPFSRLRLSVKQSGAPPADSVSQLCILTTHTQVMHHPHSLSKRMLNPRDCTPTHHPWLNTLMLQHRSKPCRVCHLGVLRPLPPRQAVRRFQLLQGHGLSSGLDVRQSLPLPRVHGAPLDQLQRLVHVEPGHYQVRGQAASPPTLGDRDVSV
jgi:hypothetical protein